MKRKEHSQLQADKKQPSVVSRFPRHSALNKIVEVPQLQYTDEKVDITAESSEDSADDAGPVLREAGR